MIYQIAISNLKNIQDNCGMICEKSALETVTYSSEGPEKIDNEPGDSIFGFCKKYKGKLTNNFFAIIKEETA